MKREYPDAPIVAVGVVVHDGERVALVRRAKEPNKGLWTFPGGAVELGEPIILAAQREALEETGLEIEVGDVLTAVEWIDRDETGRVRYHYLIVDYLARPVGGALRAGDDASDVCWAGLADLDRLDMTERAREIARELLAGAVR